MKKRNRVAWWSRPLPAQPKGGGYFLFPHGVEPPKPKPKPKPLPPTEVSER